MKHISLKTIDLKNHPELNEKWLQEVIAADPGILKIGDVILKDKERIQAGKGRLDLLLQDADGHGRYEVEIQLGRTDESHIIRTIEYWDIEKRKYPQYDHTAVIIAEDITSRFLNVISLFNGFIPLMALQVTAIQAPDGVGLHFTKILDTVNLGYLDDGEGTTDVTDRGYWETERGTKRTVALADEILELSRAFVSSIEFSYNKYYIGFWVNGRACNFAICKPQRNALKLEIRLPKDEENDELVESSGLDYLDYDKRWGSYKIKLSKKDIAENKELLSTLLKKAYDLRQ